MEYLPINMLREDLENIPQRPLPAGFAVRLFRDEDRKTWVRVQRAAESYIKVSGKLFDREFGSDLPALTQRCFFLLSPEGRQIGTITAWYDHCYAGKSWGRIHWVAIVPEFQGRGLSKPIMTVAMNRLRSLGHRRAILGTQTPRIAAIKVYLDFGFVPDMTLPAARQAWTIVREILPHPTLDRLLK